MAEETKLRKIILIGGGFAGLHFARAVSRGQYEVLLIDKVNHHMFQPLFYQVASAGLEPSSISFPFRKIFQGNKRVDFLMAEVTRVDPRRKEVSTTAGVHAYDILVIATGCNTNFFGNAQIGQYALPMKSTAEAITIRNRILLGFEELASHGSGNVDELLNLVITGAGPTGVELAGAFAEMRNNMLPHDYPRVDWSRMNIILLEGGPTTLGSMGPAAQQSSRSYLEDLGVKVLTGVTLKSYDGRVAQLSNDTVISTRNLIWAAGVKGNIIQGLPDTSVQRNRYITDRFNRITGCADIYALGDIALMETPKYPKGHPQVANVAINQAKNLARNLLRDSGGKGWREYEYRDLGAMATIGRHKAVVELPFWRFQGYWAWFVWMFLHLMLILGVRNKLIIFINWAWSYISHDSALRLILNDQSKDRK